MVNSMGSWLGNIRVCFGTIHSGTSLGYFLSSGITWGYDVGVAFFIAPIFILMFAFFWVYLLKIYWVYFLLDATVGVPLGMPPQLVP